MHYRVGGSASGGNTGMGCNGSDEEELEPISWAKGMNFVQEGFDLLGIVGSEISTELIGDDGGGVHGTVFIYPHRGGTKTIQVL